MKAKHFAIVVLLLSTFTLKAQENYIIYTEYHPDTCFTFESIEDNFILDINQDGNPDVFFAAYWHSAAGLIINMYVGSNWRFCDSEGGDPLTESTIINDSLQWSHPQGSSDLGMYPDYTQFAFRHQIEDGYHYGWAHIYLGSAHRVCVSGMGYCLLPNQPIHYGETQLFDIEEKEAPSAFVTVHPNPTNGEVTIIGMNLSQAQVINMLGQQVISRQGKGDEIQINMSALPAGIYFVAITNEEGQKCMRKVVKE